MHMLLKVNHNCIQGTWYCKYIQPTIPFIVYNLYRSDLKPDNDAGMGMEFAISLGHSIYKNDSNFLNIHF